MIQKLYKIIEVKKKQVVNSVNNIFECKVFSKQKIIHYR